MLLIVFSVAWDFSYQMLTQINFQTKRFTCRLFFHKKNYPEFSFTLHQNYNNGKRKMHTLWR